MAEICSKRVGMVDFAWPLEVRIESSMSSNGEALLSEQVKCRKTQLNGCSEARHEDGKLVEKLSRAWPRIWRARQVIGAKSWHARARTCAHRETRSKQAQQPQACGQWGVKCGTTSDFWGVRRCALKQADSALSLKRPCELPINQGSQIVAKHPVRRNPEEDKSSREKIQKNHKLGAKGNVSKMLQGRTPARSAPLSRAPPLEASLPHGTIYWISPCLRLIRRTAPVPDQFV
ncbi:hypothetical protein HAX54_032867 [Datura stramonium]|uniref:Uncharacterized protein n=1 Tax=Datura stramonium TaxID=4076 RepID=A0ABS8RM46_DATST|nr:hypothetical protein [Datura stramonium]